MFQGPENKFQHTAPTQRGNSGGPVFDTKGSVIGVSVSVLADYIPGPRIGAPQIVNIAQNINFAIHFDVVVKFLKENDIRVSIATIDPTRSAIALKYEELLNPTEKTEVPLGTLKTEAKKFTVPVLGFKHKTDPPLSVEEITIDELK